MDIKQALKNTFGFEDFRTGQQQAIEQLLMGHSSLAIFPTGSGKSLCYQLVACQLPHLTLVVSPLLALIKDQLAFLAAHNIPAASIDSSLSAQQHQEIIADVKQGRIKILMVSVERFKNERFRQFIEQVPISMLVVDEAHCISEWGHNFRPDYLKLPIYKQQLNIPLTLLLTATATKQVKQDMAAKFAIKPEHIVRTGFYRPNLDISVLPISGNEKNTALLKSINAQQINNQQAGSIKACGIVYVTLQQSAESVASYLKQQGINAAAYHAGFVDEERQRIQQEFMQGDIQIIVATIAFGMGIDKADVRFVIHYDLPKSLENFSQEIGRAGRDALPSNCITLANLDSLTVLENFIYGDTPEKIAIELLLTALINDNQYGRWEIQITSLANQCNIRQLPLKTLLVQLELIGIIEPLYSYFADYRFKFITEQKNILQHFDESRQQFLTQLFECSVGKKVWYTPDFDLLMQRHQKERNRAIAALEYLESKGMIALESKQMTDVYQVSQNSFDVKALAEQLYQYFVEKEQKEIARITQLIDFLQSPTCLTAGLADYFDDNHAPKQCQHCSVCRGNIAKLSRSLEVNWPSDTAIAQAVEQLNQHLQDKTDKSITIDSSCRFLAGMTGPWFSRFRVKQLSGFGLCQQLPYANIKKKVNQLDLL
ncbi:MAG: RecQ family ATP-dependent DNA helicase [Colwellia sp.]